MTQFDPSMVAQMLMQPIQRASENLGGGPFGIGADAGGSYFVDPEVAARTGYGTAVTGTSFFPGAGIVDAAGGAVDITGQPLPSFSENIREGQFTDAGLQALGVAGDIATIAAPLTGGASALVGAMMKAPGAARKISKATDVASDVAGIAKVEPPTETQPGIIAFHGSGADFDEFKLEFIGTGEGAQAFGYGLYFSDSRDIGTFYKNALTRSVDIDGKPYIRGNSIRNTELLDPDIADELGAANGDLELAIKDEEEYLQTLTGSQPTNTSLDTAAKETQKRIEKLKALRGRVKVNPTEGTAYKVALEPKVDELLDYDKPLSEQPKILENLENTFGEKELNDLSLKNAGVDSEKLTGRRLYKLLTGKYGSDKLASEELSKSGIKGIKFLTGGARGTFGGELLSVDKTADGQFRAKVVLDDPNRQTGLGGSGRTITTSKPYKTEKEARDWADDSIRKEENNYVIFDDKLINILEKYGIVGPVAVSATAAALRDDDGST